MRGAGRATFAAVLLLIAGTLNIVYGIGALDSANIFTSETRYIFTNLNTMGWVMIVLGVIQLTGGFSLLAGNTYGRVIGIIAGSLGAIRALFSIGGAEPVVVAGHLLPVRVGRLRHPRPRRRRARAGNLSAESGLARLSHEQAAHHLAERAAPSCCSSALSIAAASGSRATCAETCAPNTIAMATK